jgi:hypothetical protein
MSKYPNPLYEQFVAELNLQLKPPEDNIKISSYLIYGAGRIELRIKISSKLFQNKPKFYIWCNLIPNRQNMKF